MAETDLTKLIKKELYYYAGANKLGIYGGFEITLGDGYGNERVDFMTMDCYDNFKCYEIKVSYGDLKSKCKLSFHGDYNYLVLSWNLYEYLMENDMLNNYMDMGKVGILYYSQENNNFVVVSKAKKMTVLAAEKVKLMHCMVRSLSRLTKAGNEE